MSRAHQQNRREYWRQRIAQQKASGQTVRALCEENQLCEQSFYRWRRQLAAGVTASDRPVTFALVETTRSPAPSQMLELVLRGGERLYIPAEDSIGSTGGSGVFVGVLKKAGQQAFDGRLR